MGDIIGSHKANIENQKAKIPVFLWVAFLFFVAAFFSLYLLIPAALSVIGYISCKISLSSSVAVLDAFEAAKNETISR